MQKKFIPFMIDYLRGYYVKPKTIKAALKKGYIKPSLVFSIKEELSIYSGLIKNACLKFGKDWRTVNSIWIIDNYSYSVKNYAFILENLNQDKKPVIDFAPSFESDDFLNLYALGFDNGEICVSLEFLPSEYSSANFKEGIVWYKFYPKMPFVLSSDHLAYKSSIV